MADITRPQLSPEERQLSYAKYYDVAREPMNPVVLQSIKRQLDEEDCLDVADIAEMFAPGYARAAIGYRNWGSGSYASMYTTIPGVSTRMVDWWFTWMFVPPATVPREQGNLRYKIWQPEAHFDHYPADEESWAQLTNEDIPIHIRRRGVREVAKERIDSGTTEYKALDMRFRDYSELYLPDECWKYIEGAGTLNILANDHNVTLQFFRDTPLGCELILRTWRGYHIGPDGRIAVTEDYAGSTDQHIIDDLLHTQGEMRSLAMFLPELYAEEHKKPIGS